MVVLPLAAGNEGGRAHRPLPRHHQHAEWFGEIETGGGRGTLQLVRSDQWMRPPPVEQRRGHWWRVFRLVARVGRWCERQRLLAGLPGGFA